MLFKTSGEWMDRQGASVVSNLRPARRAVFGGDATTWWNEGLRPG